MQLYKINSWFVFDGIERMQEFKLVAPPVEIETKKINYDTNPITNLDSIIICGRKTKNRKTGELSQGVKFGFDSVEAFFNMICASIDSARLDQLEMKSCSERSRLDRPTLEQLVFGGSLITENTVFYLNLEFIHGVDIVAIIESTNTGIIHNLCNNVKTHKQIKEILTSEKFLGSYKSLGLYVKYHNLVLKKIYELIDSLSFSNSEFPYTCITCYRPECSKKSVYMRASVSGRNSCFCKECRIAEFCLLCGKVSHGGVCNTMPDEMTQEWINSNTRRCPLCNVDVEKNEGCNHMSCRCGAHFCWTCGVGYELNDINAHYADANPFGPCRII
jgi:hypothetical protein